MARVLAPVLDYKLISTFHFRRAGKCFPVKLSIFEVERWFIASTNFQTHITYFIRMSESWWGLQLLKLYHQAIKQNPSVVMVPFKLTLKCLCSTRALILFIHDSLVKRVWQLFLWQSYPIHQPCYAFRMITLCNMEWCFGLSPCLSNYLMLNVQIQPCSVCFKWFGKMIISYRRNFEKEAHLCV